MNDPQRGQSLLVARRCDRSLLQRQSVCHRAGLRPAARVEERAARRRRPGLAQGRARDLRYPAGTGADPRRARQARRALYAAALCRAAGAGDDHGRAGARMGGGASRSARGRRRRRHGAARSRRALRFPRTADATRILDPACGTGNFLYVAMEALLRLESRGAAVRRRRSAVRWSPRSTPTSSSGWSSTRARR